MVLQNNKGSTLIENVVAVFLLSVFCIMAFTTIIARVNTLQSLTAMEQEINTAYSELEATTYSSNSVNSEDALADDWAEPVDVTISFKIYDGAGTYTEPYTLYGTYIADGDGIIGEIKS